MEESIVLSVVKRHQIQSGALCFLPALFLSFLWRSDSQTLIHVTVEQPENVASGEEAWGGKHLRIHRIIIIITFKSETHQEGKKFLVDFRRRPGELLLEEHSWESTAVLSRSGMSTVLLCFY